jgi:hypothetical protein
VDEVTETLSAKLPKEIRERVASAAIESAFTFFMVIFLRYASKYS